MPSLRALRCFVPPYPDCKEEPSRVEYERKNDCADNQPNKISLDPFVDYSRMPALKLLPCIPGNEYQIAQKLRKHEAKGINIVVFKHRHFTLRVSCGSSAIVEQLWNIVTKSKVDHTHCRDRHVNKLSLY